MAAAKKPKKKFLNRIFGEDGEMAHYTHEQLFGDGVPKVDMLLTSQTGSLTPQQRAAMPDGLRQSSALQMILNFAYDDTELPFLRTIACGVLRRREYKLTEKDLLLVVVYRADPDPELMADFGYEPTARPAIYRSSVDIFKGVMVMALGELSGALYNANFKVFARSQAARREAYNTLARAGFPNMHPAARETLAQIAALTEEEVDNLSGEMSNAFMAGLSGTSRKDNSEPFADAPTDEMIDAVEKYLRKQS